jgi:hypothetical protein
MTLCFIQTETRISKLIGMNAMDLRNYFSGHQALEIESGYNRIHHFTDFYTIVW